MRRLLVVLFVAGTTASACAGSTGDQSAPPTTPVSAEASTSSTSEAPAPEPEPDVSVVAEATTPTIDVYDLPAAGTPTRTLDVADEISGKLVFLATGETSDDRVEVFLPIRPNGATGWVDRSDVSLSSHAFRMEVLLTEHRLKVFEGEEIVLDTAIGVGTNDTPTPGGVFFIKELLRPPSPTSAYGSYAYGLSGFSTVLETFNGGNGVIGIHGTNDPSSIGSDVSHGCIRLVNEDIETLVEQVGLPLGTPVAILA